MITDDAENSRNNVKLLIVYFNLLFHLCGLCVQLSEIRSNLGLLWHEETRRTETLQARRYSARWMVLWTVNMSFLLLI